MRMLPWKRYVAFVVQDFASHNAERMRMLLKLDKGGGDKPRDSIVNTDAFQREAMTKNSTHDVHKDQPLGFSSTSSKLVKANRSGAPISKRPANKLRGIVDGVYWSKKLDSSLPRGFSDYDVILWEKLTSGNFIANVSVGCGRMQNRVITFGDGTKSCARYRLNLEQIQGEIYVFYLSRLLGITNVPPSRLAMIHPREKRWAGVLEDLVAAEWQLEKPFVLSQYVEDIEPAYIPVEMRYENRSLAPSEKLFLKTEEELKELAQWSDLIVLDYLTGNVDRVVNNMFNEQWNSFIMDAPAHNLDKVAPSSSRRSAVSPGLLVFYDNESGLMHSYRLLDTYQAFHERLLKNLCIFRRKSANAIKMFHKNQNLAEVLWRTFATTEPEMAKMFPRLPPKNEAILNTRISDVYNQIQRCEKMYGEF